MRALVFSTIFSTVFSAVLSAVMVLASATPAMAATTEEMLAQAQKAFAERDYTAAGIQRAQEAADLYAQIATQTTDVKLRVQYDIAQSEALYFVGNASADKATKISKHLKGMELADETMKAFGVSDVTKVSDAQINTLKQLPADQLALLGEALYYRGINLGQWGAANGVAESLSRWGELRSNMELIINIGLKSIHDYGANRVIGRGYYKIPALLGGSMRKAERYMTEAMQNTLVPGMKISKNGFNTLYMADILKDSDRKAEAKALLQEFIAADAATISPEAVIETIQAQQDAKALLKSL